MKSLVIFALICVCNTQKFNMKHDIKEMSKILKHSKHLFELSQIDGYDDYAIKKCHTRNPLLISFALSKDPHQTGVIVGDRLITQATDVSGASIPWIVSFIENVGGRLITYGPGAIIHRNFAITHALLIDSIDRYANVRIVSHVDTIGDTNPPAIVRTMFGEPQYFYGDNTESTLALIRICPPVTDPRMIAPLPAPNQNYAINTPIAMYNYQPRLRNANKTINPNDCSAYTLFPQTNTFCAANHANIKIISADYRGHIAVVNGYYAGFSIACCNGGELFLDISKFYAWIDSVFKIL